MGTKRGKATGTPIPADEREQHVWTYAGQRLLTTGKLGDMWIDHTGSERLFASHTLGPIAGTYRVTVDKRNTTFYSSGSVGPSYLGLDVDHPRRAEWAAEDRADKTRYERTLQLARDKKRGDSLSESLAAVRAAYHTLALPKQRAALLASVIEEITRYREPVKLEHPDTYR